MRRLQLSEEAYSLLVALNNNNRLPFSNTAPTFELLERGLAELNAATKELVIIRGVNSELQQSRPGWLNPPRPIVHSVHADR